jgi:protein-tyrosine phosphatase
MLPGVDDGSDSMDTSLLMASMAAESGVETVIVTPHCNIPGEAANYPSRELLGRFMALRETIDAAKIPLRILAGAEVFCTADIAELIRAKKLLTLASSRYILVEFAFNEDSIEMNSCLEQIFAEGLTPVIAHPERYNAVQRDRTLPERWFASGYVLQVNKDSIFGGSKVDKVAKEFGIENTARLPIDPVIAAMVDAGEVESVDGGNISGIADVIERRGNK